jgi:hypothetical protein
MRAWLVLALLLAGAGTAAAQRARKPPATPEAAAAPAAAPTRSAAAAPSENNLAAEAMQVADDICLGTFTQLPPGQAPAKCCLLCFAGDRHRIRDDVDGMPDRYLRTDYDDVIMNIEQEVRGAPGAAAAPATAAAAAAPEDPAQTPAPAPDPDVIAERAKLPVAEVKLILQLMPKDSTGGGKAKTKRQATTLTSYSSLASLASPQLGAFGRGPSTR